MKTLAASLLLFSGLLQACEGLEITDAWIREAPPGSMMTAAYAKLRNTGNQLLIVDGTFSSEFGGAELHRTVLEDGISRMLARQTIELLPGQRQTLEPGGYHLMLFRPNRPLKTGDKVPLALRCGKKAVEAFFTIRASVE